MPAVTAVDESDNDYCESYGMYFHTVDFNMEVSTPAQVAELAKVTSELDELHETYMDLAKVFEDEFQGSLGDWSSGSFVLAFRDLYESGGGNIDWVHVDDHLRMYRILKRFSDLCMQVTQAVEIDVAADLKGGRHMVCMSGGDGLFYYGRCLDNCRCGTTVYVKTIMGCFTFEDLDENVITQYGVLKSNLPLTEAIWPLPC